MQIIDMDRLRRVREVKESNESFIVRWSRKDFSLIDSSVIEMIILVGGER